MKVINGKKNDQEVKNKSVKNKSNEFLNLMLKEEEEKNPTKISIKNIISKQLLKISKKILKEKTEKVYLKNLLDKLIINKEIFTKVEDLIRKKENDCLLKNKINNEKLVIDDIFEIQSDKSEISVISLHKEFKKKGKLDYLMRFLKTNDFEYFENSYKEKEEVESNNDTDENKILVNEIFFDRKLKSTIDKVKSSNLLKKSNLILKDQMRRTNGFREIIQRQKKKIKKIKDKQRKILDFQKEKEIEDIKKLKRDEIQKNLVKIEQERIKRNELIKSFNKNFQKAKKKNHLYMNLEKNYQNQENFYYSTNLKNKKKLDLKEINNFSKKYGAQSVKEKNKKDLQLPLFLHQKEQEKKRAILKQKLEKINNYTEYVKKNISPKMKKQIYISEFFVKKSEKENYFIKINKKKNENEIKNQDYLNYSINMIDKNKKKEHLSTEDQRYSQFLEKQKFSKKYQNFLPLIKIPTKTNLFSSRLKNSFKTFSSKKFDKNNFYNLKEDINLFEKNKKISDKEILNLARNKLEVLKHLN